MSLVDCKRSHEQSPPSIRHIQDQIRCISSIIGGDEITCLAGLPGAAKAGIMALDPCNFPVLEPRATCLKTLT